MTTPPRGPARPRNLPNAKQDNDLSLNAHRSSDVDSGPNSQHHTLGTNRNQASDGSHIHDGQKSKKLGDGLDLVLTGAKGGNVALTNLITMLKTVVEFTDNTT